VHGILWVAFETHPVSALPPVDRITNGHRLTPHFTVGEFTLSQPARRFTQQHQLQTALRLAQFLEKVRAKFGGPIIITSGHRPAAVNRAVGGDPISEHLYRQPEWGAVDFFLSNGRTADAERWCDANWPESVGLGVMRHGFVHLGIGWRKHRGLSRWLY